MRSGGFYLFGGVVLLELDVVEHESEVFFSGVVRASDGQVAVLLDEFEADGELAATEVGLLEGLPLASAALEHFEVFADGFRLG